MTKDIVSRAKTMNCKANLVRFLSLLYLVVNHRKFVNSWQELSSVADEQEFHAKLISIAPGTQIMCSKYRFSENDFRMHKNMFAHMASEQQN